MQNTNISFQSPATVNKGLALSQILFWVIYSRIRHGNRMLLEGKIIIPL